MADPLAVLELGNPGRTSIVLLHGAGTSGWMWHEQADRLAERFHVLVPDLPGHGLSAATPWESIDAAGLQIAELIATRCSNGVAHVTGLSLGGYVALALATASPSRSASAIVSGVNVLPFPHPRALRLLGALMDPFTRTRLMIDLNARTLRIPPESRDGYRVSVRQVGRRTTSRVTADAIAYRLPEAAARSDVPVLAVAGEHEHPLVLNSLATIAGGFPRGVAAAAPGGRHAWNAERPELFTAMITDWVDREAIAEGLTPLVNHP